MGFLDKNRDEIRDDIMSVLQSSSNPFLKSILPEAEVAVVQAGQVRVGVCVVRVCLRVVCSCIAAVRRVAAAIPYQHACRPRARSA